ncbi:MAG: hypothetical protein GY786_03980 [Proteobacteria bacterium]|nr:hypothetical protein [Pseudomonadota bacterium]
MVENTGTLSIDEQSIAQKMFLMRVLADRELGEKWKYFNKIKHSDDGFDFLKKETLMDQMKATRSALQFTTKATRKQFQLLYKACISEIISHDGADKQDLPALPETSEEKGLPTLSSQQDGLIVTWTPIKFLLPAEQIRDKGKATQRHSEGLVAKLYFKVVGFYSSPENWKHHNLTFYLNKLDASSTFPQVVEQLEPLKKDLAQFSKSNELFKFGDASLAKDANQELDAFDDAMGNDSFEQQIQSLYWHQFIYFGLELFLFKYFLTLVTATDSENAQHYLLTIFEPAINKAIENRNLFMGSFETDRSKHKFLRAFKEYTFKRASQKLKSNIVLKGKGYEIQTYNLTQLQNNGLGFDLKAVPKEGSPWFVFLGKLFTGNNPLFPAAGIISIEGSKSKDEGNADSGADVAIENKTQVKKSLGVDAYLSAFIHIFAFIVNCEKQQYLSRIKILENMKERIVADHGIVQKRVKELKKQGEVKSRGIQKKINTFKRMKQDETALTYQKELEKFQSKTEERCEFLEKQSEENITKRKTKLNALINNVDKKNSKEHGTTARKLLDLTRILAEDEKYTQDFLKFTLNSIKLEYIKVLEPFYKNLFPIFNPTVQDKVAFIQALEKSGLSDSIKLALTDNEKEEFQNIITEFKEQVKESLPNIFECKLILLAMTIQIDDLFNLGIEHMSMNRLLGVKLMSPKITKSFTLSADQRKLLISLNQLINPVPKHNIIQPGMEKNPDPEKSINANLMHQLISHLD